MPSQAAAAALPRPSRSTAPRNRPTVATAEGQRGTSDVNSTGGVAHGLPLHTDSGRLSVSLTHGSGGVNC